ncbi:MAG: FAD-linked oxidase C-terminal domain-containing protein [Cytophagales bacterium]
MLAKLEELKTQISGDFFTDTTTKTLYATDASVYREMPTAVARPKTKDDIKKLIAFANQFNTSLIPRTAGTSLAGQVVGSGIVVDVSKYWNKIIELNIEEKWVKVEPGVNLDELNKFLLPKGLFFGPETSTSNRCMIGGMVGNNSCGSHSIIYGTTRDHLLELEVILSDGSEAVFSAISKEEFDLKCQLNNKEGELYRFVQEHLSKPEVQEEIRKEFPKRSIRRRNTGYAIDELLETEVFSDCDEKFNFCKLLAGSEGTLAFTTSIKLNLVEAPPKTEGVLAVHLNSFEEAAKATIIARKYNPGAIELLDDIVINCARTNIEQQKNLFFIKDTPKAVIVVEWARHEKEEIEKLSNDLETELKSVGLGYHFPKVWGADIKKIWTLRKAGLGLLANVPGDPKAVACIEDTAVDIHDQPAFVVEFQEILKKYNQESVFYAHIGDGEIHLRPILDLKKETDRKMFFDITNDVAELVKKFGGSMSGEHGDGRVRGEFVKKMIGEKNYSLIKALKASWDPKGIFNPGKIVDTPKMNEFLRYESEQPEIEIETIMSFDDTQGLLRMAEKCNGSGDCRKSHLIGGTMCPSYMATRNEKETTRARANILREFLTRSNKKNRFDHQEIYEVYDLCLSCKGCKSECPSNVDVATMKAEFLQHYYDSNGVPLRTHLIGNITRYNQLGMIAPGITNFFFKNKFTSSLMKKSLGFAPKRDLPLLHTQTFRTWANKNLKKLNPEENKSKKKIYLFADEFTDYNDVEIGMDAVRLLTGLGYYVVVPKHLESGRTHLSKGLVRSAKQLANKNIEMLADLVSNESPILGIEPSAILSFRDEYLRLAEPKLKSKAEKLANNSFLIDEFLSNEFKLGNIAQNLFTTDSLEIKLHGHCHQKALSSVEFTKNILSLPENYKVEVIPSGCCGMAGSFGYEAEHYEVSMQVGELVLFPSVRNSSEETIIVAPGTSCRHQIFDGTNKKALHPVQVLLKAMK